MSLSANRFYYTNTNHNDTSNVLINYNNLTGNNELIQHPLSKYARELFFSPTYNNVFFNSINWANSLGIYKNQNNLINPLVDNVLMNIDILDDTILPQSLINHIVKMGHINGENSSDEFGKNVSSNTDGTIIAISSRKHDSNKGHVRIYEWDGSSWDQLGNDIDGQVSGDFFGRSVSLNANGKIVAIGAHHHDGNKGCVSIYEWDGSSWQQMGNNIVGEAADDYSGFSVSLSNDGKIVAIGAYYNDGINGTNSGHVRVYDYVEGRNPEWDQLGSDIDGESSGDNSGWSISLSSNGKILAISAPYNNGNGGSSGHVRVYEYNDNAWDQMGSDIDAEAAGDYVGYESGVSLSDDGTILAIGAHANDGNGDGSGHVRVFKYNGSAWNQMGNDIDGEKAGDLFGITVSLSADGTILAIGSHYNNNKTGHVRVYQYISGQYTSDWIQVGYDIDGENIDDLFGIGLSLSKDGSVLVAGAYGYNGNSGRVYTYELLTQPITSILNMGSPINGPHNDSYSGMSVSCNDDCSIIAIGGPGYGDNTFFDYNTPRTYIHSGGARVYQYINNSWQYMFAVSGRYNEEQCGCSVALNADGTIFAVGANHGTGCVRVYDYVQGRSPEWQQMGSNIIGSSGHGSGWSISLSDDGTVLAVGGIFASNFTGRATMYKWNGTSWQNKGAISGTSNSWAGWSVSLNGDGNKVAVGALNSNGGRGHVMVYEWNGSWWASTATINGEMGGGLAGHSVSFSDDGNTLAIGAPKNSTGTVCVYKWDGSTWNKLGSTIYADSGTSRGGYSCSLNDDGTILAFGASGGRGRVYIYQYINGLYASGWVKIGYIDGEAGGDRYGAAISLSKSGSKLVTGALYNDITGTNSGRAYTYELFKQPIFKSIIKIDPPINGESASDSFGYCVSSNADGTIIAASAPYNDDSEIDSGNVRIYKYIKVNEEPIIYQSWKISDVTSNSMTIGTAPWMPNYEVYVKVTPVNSGNKFRLRFQGGSGSYEIKDIRIAKYISGRDPALFSNFDPWYTISIDGTSGETFVSIPAYGQKWTDWINAPIEANTPYLVYFKYHASRDYYSYWTTSTTNSWVNGSEENRVYNIDLMEVKYSDGRMQMGNTIYGESVNDYSGYSISLNADGTIIAIGAQMQYSDANLGPVAGHVRLFKYFEPNNDIDNYNDHTYFGIIPTRRSSNKYWTFYSYKITQSGVDIVYFNGSNYNNLIWNSSTLPSGPHGWGWQYGPSQIWTNTATPLWYVETNANIDGTPLTFELINYDHNHTPLSGNFVSASSPNGPWVVRDSWSLNSPLTTVGSTPTFGYKIISDLNPRWIQMGNDIDGEDARDYFGSAVSLNGDGTIVAIGAYMHNSTTGHVRIYEWDGSSWQKMGSDIDGKGVNRDRCGYSVSFSADEKIVAIGSPYNNDAGNARGHTRIYKYINDNWTQLGLDINGESNNDESGSSVSLNADGTIVAIGARYNDGTGSASKPNSGHVRIYNYDENREPKWKQMGNDIDGEAPNDYSSGGGQSVSLSADGTIVAIGAHDNDGNGNNSGHVRVFKYDEINNIWLQIGYDIDGEEGGYQSGWSVSLSKNGLVLVVGELYNNANGTNSGRVFTYEIVDIDNTVEENN